MAGVFACLPVTYSDAALAALEQLQPTAAASQHMGRDVA
jgi:hypothetical protein